MASSILYPGERVINDESPAHWHAEPAGMSRGLALPSEGERSYAGVAEPFPSNLLVPRSEWQARIQEKEERKARLSDLVTLADLPCKDQNGTNYCWFNAPTYCAELLRVAQNQAKVILSPASGAAQVTNYRNVGGWGRTAVEWIVEHGLVPADQWPANAIDPKYATAENKALALKYRFAEWFALQPRDLDEYISCLLRNIPVAIGLNWWQHEVTGVEAVWLDGDIATRIRNSWGMGWGSQGYGVLQGSKMLPDDACGPRTALAA